MFVKDKLVAEELRNLVVGEQLLLATASQLNRSAVESVEFEHSMIAGGLSKIQTADNVFGIYSTPTMRERCMVQLQFMKTRSSGSVGQKIELSFNPDTLRITDMDSDSTTTASKASDVYEKIKSRTNLGTTVTPTETGTQSTKWEKPQAKEGFDILKPNSGIAVASNANRDALRAIVSRET